MTHYLYYLSYTCIWRTQKELVIILLKVRQLLRHIDVSLLFSKKSLVVVLELARREQVVSCSHKNGWARPEIEKTFFTSNTHNGYLGEQQQQHLLMPLCCNGTECSKMWSGKEKGA